MHLYSGEFDQRRGFLSPPSLFFPWTLFNPLLRKGQVQRVRSRMHAHKLRAGIIYIYSGGLDEHLLLPLSPPFPPFALNSLSPPTSVLPTAHSPNQDHSLFFRCIEFALSFFLSPLPRSFSSSCFLHPYIRSLSREPSHGRTRAVVPIGHANPVVGARARDRARLSRYY